MPKTAGKDLTDALIRGAKPKGAELRLRDARCRGLCCRVRPTGRREFTLTTSWAGRRVELTLGDHAVAAAGTSAARGRELAELPPWTQAPHGLTLSEARTLADRVRSFVRSGGDPVAKRQAERDRQAEAEAARRADAATLAAGGTLPGSFGDLARRWLAFQRQQNRSPAAIRAAELLLDNDVLPAIGATPAAEVTRASVAAIADGIAEGRGARRKRPGRPTLAGAQNMGHLVSRIYHYGIDTGFAGLVVNPAARVARRYGTATRRTRVLSKPELRALWQATEAEHPTLRGFARLLVLTALRRDELLGAAWDEVERDEFGTWLAVPGERMKGGAPHRCPLSRLAQEELQLLADVRTGDNIFPGRDGGARREVFHYRERLQRKVIELLAEPAADPRGWTWHDCRRTARSLLAEAGAADVPAELMLAHQPAALRGVAGAYNRHLYRRELQQVAELLGAAVQQIVEDVRPGAVLPFARPR